MTDELIDQILEVVSAAREPVERMTRSGGITAQAAAMGLATLAGEMAGGSAGLAGLTDRELECLLGDLTDLLRDRARAEIETVRLARRPPAGNA